MRRALTLVLLGGAVLTAQAPARITASSFLAHVTLLASDEMGGRGNGTAGLEHAADYIATAFRDAGLRGGGADGGFFQGFDAEVRVEPPATSTVMLGTPAGVQSFVLGRDYYPLSIRDRLTPPLGVRDVPVVFAGYGDLGARASATTTSPASTCAAPRCWCSRTSRRKATSTAASTAATSPQARRSRPRRARPASAARAC